MGLLVFHTCFRAIIGHPLSYRRVPDVMSFYTICSLDVISDSWSRGYDVALTRRRSPVQFRPGPPSALLFSVHQCINIGYMDIGLYIQVFGGDEVISLFLRSIPSSDPLGCTILFPDPYMGPGCVSELVPNRLTGGFALVRLHNRVDGHIRLCERRHARIIYRVGFVGFIGLMV